MKKSAFGSMLLALVAAVSPVRPAPASTGLLTLTLTGPATFVPGAVAGFNGSLLTAAGGVGLPQQKIDMIIDGALASPAITGTDGTFTYPAVFTDVASHTLEAVAYAGTPLETHSQKVTIDVARVTLTVVIDGRGGGVVRSAPTGIDCGGDCNEAYPVTTSVMLTATADTGSVFGGWSGACSGSSTQCAVSMSEAKTARARFDNVPARLTTGIYWTCGVLLNGSAKCWGQNDKGQLGDGTTTNRSTPVPVPGLTNVVDMSAGYDHTCALLSGGTVSCWGGNASGQLGDGTTTSRSIAAPVSGITSAVGISTGYDTSCAVLAGGSVRCWGANWNGQLGDGTQGNTRLLPVTVVGLTDAVEVAGGSDHVCALRASERVVCWGDGVQGQLGILSLQSLNKPGADVAGLSGATMISAEREHTCALLRDRTVRCWGSNSFGQIGDGTTTKRTSAVAVNLLPPAVRVTAGYDFTCAVLTDGTQRCWGWNAFGQLGNGSTASSAVPVPVSALSGVIAASSGGLHECALLSGGGARCWGYNGYGEIGDGTTVGRTTPAAVVSFP